jgi:hypothetical protein
VTSFEVIVAGAAVVSAGALMAIAGRLADIRRDVKEIWQRMPRID